MAKKPLTVEVQVLLWHSVTLGEGEDAKDHPAGTTVAVSQEVADEIVALKAGAFVPSGEVADTEAQRGQPLAPAASGDASLQLPLAEGK